MFPVLHLGPLALQTPGLIIVLGIWIGLSVSEKYCKKTGLSSNDLSNITTIGLVAGILGARLIYILEHVQAFLDAPGSIYSLNEELMNPPGGLLIGALSILIYTNRNKISFLTSLDSLTPLLAILNIFIPLSNLASGNSYGSPANLPWSIYLWGENRHPSQLYETAAGIIILLVLLSLIRTRTDNDNHGVIFARFVSMSALARLFLEHFRGDSTLVFNHFREAQILAWFVLAFGLALEYYLVNKQETSVPSRRENKTQPS